MRQEDKIYKKVDGWLLLCYLLLTFTGLFNLYSASFNPEHSAIYDLDREHGKQFMWLVISLILGGMILLLEGSFIKKISYEIYGVIVFLLIAVLLVGTVRNGARAWFGVGGFGIQPSEFAKIGLSLALAKFLSTPNIKLQDKQTKQITLGLILLPALLILLQPDTGTVIVFASFIFVIYREGIGGNILLFGFFSTVLAVLSLILKDTTFVIIGIGELSGQIWLVMIFGIISLIIFFIIRKIVMKRNRKFAILVLGVVYVLGSSVILLTNFGFNKVLAAHQKDRIEILLGQKEDPKVKGYNIDRSKAAIGSGQWSGKGYMKSTLSNASQKHVPMQTTDFIYCTWSEEWGFQGSVAVILVFLFMLIRMIIIAERQRSHFTRIYAYCVACIIFFHVLINIGMTIGLAPVIGIPLPFFSYGGSSLFAFSILVFILLRLDSERLNVLR
jgi:rod shape determining protein RodA